MNDSIIKCFNLRKSYIEGKNIINVLNNIDLNIIRGEKIAIVGPSGSGKSTLLHLLGGLDKPTSGNVVIDNQDLQDLSEKKRCALRNHKLGFIYQFHHLLPEFSAIENVAMPLMLRKSYSYMQAKLEAKEFLCKVGLMDRLEHKPSELSGGERARVAIARALVHKPDCILADEPTGNLDQTTANNVFDLMLQINEQIKTALIIVTHDKNIAAKTSKVLALKNGKLEVN